MMTDARSLVFVLKDVSLVVPKGISMEMLYLLIAFVIGGAVGGTIMGMCHRANSQGGGEALRIELSKL